MVVGLALSGGGLRATGVGYGALLELEEQGLLDRIDFISAVSGGAIVGAYYALGLPLDEFGAKLNQNLFTSALGKTLNPKKIFNDKQHTRSLGFAAALDDAFFSKKKLSQLRESPYLLIGSVNVENASLFVFSRDTSADENLVEQGELPQYELDEKKHKEVLVSHAVAASAAVPSLIGRHPLVARPTAPDKDGKFPWKKIRLMDGGIFDNMGIEPLLSRKCDVVIAIDSTRSVLTPEGYSFFAPGGTKVIPITRRRYRSFLQMYAREKLGENFIHIQVEDDKIEQMSPLKVKLTKKQLDPLVEHGRKIVTEHLPSIRKAMLSRTLTKSRN